MNIESLRERKRAKEHVEERKTAMERKRMKID